MDKLNRPIVEKGMIRLYLGCCCTRHKVDIRLQLDRVLDFFENDIKRMGIDPYSISKVGVGPKTVAELYEGPNLDGKKRLVINSSPTIEKNLEIGCLDDHLIWEGDIRSFRVWSYDYYEKIHGIRYCSSDRDCKDIEYCLCPGGQRQPGWCPNEKRRCLPVSRYLQSNDPVVHQADLINSRCLAEKMANSNDDFLSFSDIRQMAGDCNHEKKVRLVEGFGSTDSSNVTIFIIVFIVVMFAFLYFGTNQK